MLDGDLCTLYTSGNRSINLETVRTFIRTYYPNYLFAY